MFITIEPYKPEVEIATVANYQDEVSKYFDYGIDFIMPAIDPALPIPALLIFSENVSPLDIRDIMKILGFRSSKKMENINLLFPE